MNFAYFPLREFTQALTVTSKVKSRLQPFVLQMENYNMEWLFQMLMQLYQYTVSRDCQISFKFNSLVALKILLETCELPITLLVEVYFLPHIRKIATYQLHETEKHRGLDFFIVQGHSKALDIKKLGYNYVRLATEMVTIMSAVKPFRMYGIEELTQPSEYINVLEIMRAHQWKQYDVFAFYQTNQEELRQIFLSKINKFSKNSQKYFDFLDSYLDKLIRKQYTPKILDPKRILESGEILGCNYVLQALKEMVNENKATIKTNILKLITQFVKWGYIKAACIIQCEGIFDNLLLMIKKTGEVRTSERGKHVFQKIEGSEEERRNLYKEVVKSLQIWAVCIPKNPMKQQNQSKSSLLYKEFLTQLKIEVPFSGNIRKIRNECEQNLEKNKVINHFLMKELKKYDFDLAKMRRTSSNLEQLIKLDENMACSIADLIKELAKLNHINIDQGSSECSFKSWTNSSLDGTSAYQNDAAAKSESWSSCNFDVQAEVYERKTYKGIRAFPDPKSKIAVNEASLSNISSVKCHFSQQQNFSNDCEQHLEINKVRLVSRNSSKTLKRNKNSETVIKSGNVPKIPSKIEFFEEEFTPNLHTGSQNSMDNIKINIYKPILRQDYIVASEYRYLQYVQDFYQLDARKLFHNKDLLLKTDKIEIGYVFKLISSQVSEVTIYLMPFEDLKKLNWQIQCSKSITYTQKGEKFMNISQNNQKKLVFQLTVKTPYELPKLSIEYQMKNKQYNHEIVLPLSFNKFMKYSQPGLLLNPSTILQTPLKELNTKLFQLSSFQTYFSDFQATTHDLNSILYFGTVQYQGSLFNLVFIIQDESFFQIKCELSNQCSSLTSSVQFFMIVLQSILKK